MKRIYHLCILGLVLLLPSCFEWIEEVDLNEDGSGKFQMVLNFSQSKTNIQAIQMLDEIHGYKVPSIETIEEKIEVFRDSLEQQPGISQVVTKFNKTDYIFELSCHFDKVERLNTVIYKAWKMRDEQGARYERYFSFKNMMFDRLPGSLIPLLYQKMKLADREVLVGATYTSVYRFPNLIQSQNNRLAKIAGSKKIVFLRAPIQQLIEKPELFRNSIILKP